MLVNQLFYPLLSLGNACFPSLSCYQRAEFNIPSLLLYPTRKIKRIPGEKRVAVILQASIDIRYMNRMMAFLQSNSLITSITQSPLKERMSILYNCLRSSSVDMII
jgi:hypothetical protein